MIRLSLPMPPTDTDIVDAYVDLGSVWKAADVLGMTGQAVHGRLTKMGSIKPMRVFSAEEKARTIEYYTQTPSDQFDLNVLAAEMGRTKQFICRKARELGLTNPKRPDSSATVDKNKRPKWQSRQHPRGALGMKHTEETKEKLASASRLAWATDKTFGIGLMGEGHRQRRSDQMAQWRASQPSQSPYSRAKGGVREDIGSFYFRSAWEANYARYLNWLKSRSEIERWEYEPETFWFLAVKRGVRSYKPDFKVWERGKSYFVEVKGWMDDKSKTKLRRMKKYHPEIRVVVVDKRQYESIKSKVSRMIPGWENS